MTSVLEVAQAFNEFYPLRFKEDWDYPGLIFGDPERSVKRVFFCVDPQAKTIAEAIDYGADFIFSHHPLFFQPIHSLPGTEFRGTLVNQLSAHSIALYCGHTNADVAPDGTADVFARKLGLTDIEPLVPYGDESKLVTEASGAESTESTARSAAGREAESRDGGWSEPAPTKMFGLGRVGNLPVSATPVTLRQLAKRILQFTPPTVQPIKIAGDSDAPIRRVAVLPGSGDGYFDQVVLAEADVYITSDLRHHPVLDLREQARFQQKLYHRNIARPFLIDVPHGCAEAVFLPTAAEKLTQRFPLSTQISQTVHDPWDYVIG
jgi:dinuclear metal center YbgI/SA1388 family protein